MSQRRPVALFALLLSLTSLSAHAVPIGTTPDTRPAAPQQRKQWKEQGVSLQIGGTVLQGNANLINLSTALGYNQNWGPHQLFLDGANLFTKVGDTIAVNRINGSGLYAYGVLDNFNLFAYSTHSHDAINKIDYRLTNGVGACLHKLFPEVLKLGLVSAGFATEHEWFQPSLSQFAVRSVLRTNAILPVNDIVEFGVDGFYTPALPDVADYRLYGEAFARVKLAENLLALKLSVADEYDSRPQPGVGNNDFGVFTTLELDWGR